MTDKKLYLKGNAITHVINLSENQTLCFDGKEDEREHYNGSFDYIDIGIFKKKKLKVGLFCFKGTLYVFFNNKYYKESELKYSRYFIFTRIKKFKAFYQNECIQNFNYIYRYFEDDLYCDDVFYDLIDIKKNKYERRESLIKLWEHK